MLPYRDDPEKDGHFYLMNVNLSGRYKNKKQPRDIGCWTEKSFNIKKYDAGAGRFFVNPPANI
jgi:hypothetical protein